MKLEVPSQTAWPKRRLFVHTLGIEQLPSCCGKQGTTPVSKPKVPIGIHFWVGDEAPPPFPVIGIHGSPDVTWWLPRIALLCRCCSLPPPSRWSHGLSYVQARAGVLVCNSHKLSLWFSYYLIDQTGRSQNRWTRGTRGRSVTFVIRVFGPVRCLRG